MLNLILKRQMAAKKNKKKGFTLIEVIVVIVIIAILAAIAVPSLTRYIGSAGLRADMAMAHNVQVVLQAELSDQFGSPQGLTVVEGAAQTATINGFSVIKVLEGNGIYLPETSSLIEIQMTAPTAKLEYFILVTDTSSIVYNGATLQQFSVAEFKTRDAALAEAKKIARVN